MMKQPTRERSNDFREVTTRNDNGHERNDGRYFVHDAETSHLSDMYTTKQGLIHDGELALHH